MHFYLHKNFILVNSGCYSGIGIIGLLKGLFGSFLVALSSAKEFFALNKENFSSDSACCTAFKLLANTANKKVVSQPKRLKERKK
jgi:uncharacterized membrane protein